jgi:hypothetical protein
MKIIPKKFATNAMRYTILMRKGNANHAKKSILKEGLARFAQRMEQNMITVGVIITMSKQEISSAFHVLMLAVMDVHITMKQQKQNANYALVIMLLMRIKNAFVVEKIVVVAPLMKKII